MIRPFVLGAVHPRRPDVTPISGKKERKREKTTTELRQLFALADAKCIIERLASTSALDGLNVTMVGN